MNRLIRLFPFLLFLFLQSCEVDTSGCEKNCDIQFSTCLLVAVNNGTANQSSAVPFICYQICDNCKDNCKVRNSSGGNNRTGTRSTGSGSGSRGGGNGGGGGGSGGGSGGHGGGGHGGGGIVF
ncbi:hypothetical protein [Leptospira gomenensis]|uniref:hypothetical protein n=1 Tax=Leptospira gomenensis TaxID=2484974 RepID=UPI0014383FEF|nr:hypothetical protein [Leptospira gomenensis]